MGKSLLRASVCFPPGLHTEIKVAAATSTPRTTLINYVAGIVALSGRISDKALKASLEELHYDPPSKHRDATHNTAIRSTVKLDRTIAEAAKARADALNMSQSEFIVAAVAHHMRVNGCTTTK
jgi:hypothetical protein